MPSKYPPHPGLLTNERVQTTLQAALDLLAEVPVPKDEGKQVQLLLLQNSILTMKLYSASGNQFPGLQGLGMEYIFAVATQIIKDNGSTRNLRMSTRNIGRTFEVI